MKKIFTHLFALFLLSFVTTSNVWAETIELDPSDGEFSGGNSNYCKTWTSNSEPVVTFSVAEANNMTVGVVNAAGTVDAEGNAFGIARGQNLDSNWTFSVAGYKILSYSFKYKLKTNSTAADIVITVNGNANAVTSDEKTLEVSDVNASAASFTLSGTNETIILTDVTIKAEPILENGAVYRFVCSGTNSVSLGASALTDVAAVSTSETEKAQQWYVTVSDNNYTFRNLANGRYLKGNNDTSGGWALTEDSNEDSNEFTVTLVNGNYAIRGASHTNSHGYMHKDGGNNIVSWASSAANSQWTPIMVEYTPEQLEAVWEEVKALVVPSATVDTYEGYLDVLFSDKSCVTPKLATLDAAKATDAYNNLPVTLQKMVDKVYGGNWAESTVAPANRPNGNNNTNHNLWTVKDTWDNDYAKKFRVQMYEPYSVEGEITSYLRINAHCNMDNPTGIYANAGEPMYIMVEGTIAAGAELWVAHQVGHGATNYYNNVAYTQLEEGLNVVPYFADGSQLWINYLVHTYNGSGTTIAEKFPEDRQLSKYKPLKIHIEGGKINGFFNAMGDYRSTEVSGDANGGENLWGEVDNDADWDYYKARAALSGDFALLGHRQTLLFDFGTWNSTNGYFGVANADGGIEKALAWHLENIEVPATPNCYVGSGTGFGNYSDTYYPGMQLNATTGKINIMLEAWDRIQYSEHASLGLLSVANINKMNALYPRWTTAGEAAEIYNYGEATINNVTQTYQQFCQGIDYSEYFNHHGAAVGSGSGYMSGGWRVCNYHYNTMGSIIGKIAVEPGPTWGPAHEIGHQHQTIFNLNGQTEVTNNFHSNVAVWYMGMGTSRYNGSEGNLEHVLGAYNTDGNDLYTNNIWALTHLYYRLWLYYHLAGNNTQFWPRLFELLRQVPIVNGGQISGETSLLRFYQHACDAAGEDLTEFFRAHGFFELMTDRLVGDYSNGTYNVTEEQIETAITAVKANNYPENYAILLINDGTSETTLKHDGTTHRSLWDSNPSAELGSVNDFIEGNTSVTDAYDAIVSADGTVTMSGGEGGVGFLIFNEDGELVSFSNKSTFEISDEAAYLLATGKASIVAVDAESNKTESKVDLSAIQREMLKALIEKVDAMPIDNGTYTHVGFYTQASAAELLAVLDNARTVYNSNSGYGAAYEMLYTEKEKFVNSPNLSFVPFDPSLTYVITNCAYSGKTMHLNSGLKSATGVDQTANTARWQFKTTDTEGVYKLYNTAGYYLTAPTKSATVGSTATVDDAATFTLLQESPVGAWSISLSPAAEYTTLHDNSHGNVVGWSAGVDPSKWYLTAVENPNSASLVSNDELQSLIAKTEALVDVVGMAIPCTLQTTDASAPFYLYCNANVTSGGDKSLPADGYYILDGIDDTYLHTVYSGNSVDGLNHYLLLDLGEGNTRSTIQFYYKTRHNGDSNSHPQVIKVEGSNDKETFVEIETISSGLPNGYSTEYTSSELTNGNEYRYFRFMVTDTYGTATDGNGHEYFYIAEFGIPSLPDVYTKIDAEYQDYVTETDMQTIYNAIVTAKTALKSGTELSAAKEDLQDAYDTFYALYKKPIDKKKEELEALADATDELIASVGTITFGEETPITLTTSNLYCNAVLSSDGQGVAGLVDDDAGTYLHTTPNTKGEDNHDYHYLRVDLGDGVTTENFKFVYQNRDPSSYTVFPSVLTIQGSNDNSEYVDIVEISSGLPDTKGETYESQVLGNGNAYRYFRFVVTSTYAANSTPPYFCMAKFRFTAVKNIDIAYKDGYGDIVTDELLLSTYNTSGDSHTMADNGSYATLAQLDAQIADQQAAYDKLYAAMNNTAAHKENLKKLIDDTQALYDKMATDDGAVNEYYSTSALTADNLSGALAMIIAAQAVYDNSSATVDDINDAYNDLNEKYTILKGIEDLDVTDRGDLNNLIATMQSLLEQTTVNGAVETGNVALQVTNKTAPFYIWNYKPATDDNGIAALIDETDGVANTGTFTGTYWQAGNVDPYTHYLEIDLGVNNVLEDLSIDYTTRSSGYANQRPNGLKFLGSNDKETYEEFHSVISGLTTDANTKWSMKTPVELAKNYRYVRIAVSTEVGYFNMSDFNLYSSSIATVNEFYSTSDIFDCLPAVLRGYSDAKKAVAVYLLSDDYTNAKKALQLQIDALQAIIDGNVDDRTELKTLADETEPLVTEVAAFDETETELEMQCDDPSAPYYLYCNADGTKTNGSGDNVGVAALVGENKDNITHLHTTYGNNAQDDDLDHYLRLDMGEDEAIMSFKFSYTGRSTNSNNDPSEMIIHGCNTLDGDWEEIVSLTNLPTEGDGVVYNSDKIESDKAFRYIRFMVTATQNGAVNNGHPFFVLSKFSVTACKTIEVKTEYVSPNLPLSTLVTANNEVVEASAMVDDTEHYVTETAYSTAKNELQAARDALELAKNLKELPVVLTTDASNPVLYKIRINRSSTTLLQYDHASTMVAVADDNLGNEYQAWYFMQGTNTESYDDIQIFPYWGADAANTSLRLGSNDISGGNSKVKAVDGSDNAYKTNWYITFTEGTTAANWWNIQPEGKATYFSNHGGVSQKMGFLNDAGDDGSEFQFILDETDYSLSDAYYALYNLYNSYGGTKVAGTAIGCYISVDAYNSAYNAAATLIENKNATDEEYIDARTALEAAYAALERRMPVEGGFYRLKSAYTGRYSDGKYIYADAENKLYFSDASDVLSKYIWQFEKVDGGYNVKNLHTDSYIKTAGWGAQIELSSTAGKVTIETLDDELGILRINTTAYPLHAQDSGSKVVGYTGGLNSASAWYIEEVENVEEAFKHTETLSALGYGTLILNYDAKVPDGVTAYVADGVNGFDIIMTPVDNDIIPANTAVILQKDNIDGNALDMQFKYSTAASGSYGSNMLRGELYTKVVKCDTDDVNNNIYMMQNKNGAVKMYWMYENYNAEGERVQIDGSYNHDEGGYVRCTANKAYLVVPQNTAQGAAAYSFRFTGPTTGIDEVNADSGAEKVIYDLQGRKLSEITEPGIYIVNGKKIYVK